MLVTMMLLNLASLWWRSRSTERMSGFYLATLGALAIVATKTTLAPGLSPMWGVGLTLAGSVVSARSRADNFRPRSPADATARRESIRGSRTSQVKRRVGGQINDGFDAVVC